MMKKFLKSLSLVMALVMCFTMVFTAAVSADGATPTITFGVKDSVEPGTVSITVDAANFADVAGVQGQITVAGLDGAAVVAGNIDNVVIDAGVISFAREGEANDEGTKITMADGTLFTITGTAVEGTNITLAWTAAEIKACDTAEKLLTLDYADKTVEVKAPVVGPTLDEAIILDAAVAVSNTVNVSYILDGTTVSDYASYTIEVTRDAYSTVDYNATTATSTLVNPTLYKGDYYYLCTGFALVDMCLDVTAVVNCYDANGNKVAYSKPFTNNIKDLITAEYNNASKTTDKTAYTDLLNMGTEAQKYFGGFYSSSDLAADVAAGKLSNAGFDQTYASEALGELASGEGQTVDNGADVEVAGALTLSPTLSYIITADATPSDLSITLTYTNEYTGSPVEKTSKEFTLYKGDYYYSYTELPLYSSNAVITANVYDGETLLATTSYSVEQWVDMNKDDATLGAVATAIGKFGASVRVFFGMA